MIFSDLIKNKSNNIFVQLFRYLFVGGFAFVFDFGILYILTEYFQVYYLFSAAISFIIGLSINYVLSILWVFEKRTIKNYYLELFIFSFIGVVGLFLNEVILWFFTEKVGAYYLISKILATIIVLLWNFLVRKFVLFR